MASEPFSHNALEVLEARYLRRDAQRRVVETPDELFDRVARAVAEAELLLGNAGAARRFEDEFRSLLGSLSFLPNSPTLMNAGTRLGQLSACFVLPVGDSMESIFDAVKHMALVQRTGGGTGFSFSRLRPRGDVVRSTGGEASGPVSFMRIFDCATHNIKQGGRRRGANLGVLRVDHPDVLEFVGAKLDGKSFENFNLSVGVTDAFFEAVQRDEDYDLIHPRTKKVVGRRRAKDVFDAIVDAAWRCGDPGLLFLDSIARANPLPELGPIEAANPCGEVPLLAHEACNLGSVNLARMVSGRGIDWNKLRSTVRTAVRFLDDVIEVNRYPLRAIERVARANRKIGLGVMGFAEMLIRSGISYDSDEAVETAEALMRFIAAESRQASRELAEERGPFPNWSRSVYAAQGEMLRNATRTAIAPTGTIGIVAGTSPSIEPLFALAYRRSHVLEGRTLFELSPLFLDCLRREGLEAESLLEQIRAEGTLARVASIPETLKKRFVTALEIPPERHLAVQAAFQRHVDNSVSKTINLPQEATRDVVASAYLRGWELGLKGITVYRFGSRTTQVIELGESEDARLHEYGTKCDPSECRL